jgi:SAM-dependent methyltransferase
MSSPHIIRQVRQYYEGKLADHGATARGVDWNSEESQQLRFRELSHLFAADPEASVNDYGCGYGAMAAWLRGAGHTGAYCGFDISPRMIAAARERYAALPACRFVSDREDLAPADYTVASGIFNVRQDVADADWRRYIVDTIGDMRRVSRRGFAFNALTSYSDADKRRPDLYYADPLDLFDYCKRHVSRFVSLLHATPLYEFTILVRL